ncbi:hypothetical protein PanWU01x14_168180 [Parasponia andersonii]|uniref:Uncharacterized protein n=1 Tax=Parasponia andersonii TaxID=3476 RepID=A0A2P5CAZ0_PARAD|nr:hypothetical protein PanWU01x14_168180 [Parasponia andersonii]
MGASRGAPLLFLGASRSTACLDNSEAENTESNGCSNKRTENATGSSWNNEFTVKDRDSLFVANVGDYHSAVTNSARWVREADNQRVLLTTHIIFAQS